MDGNTSEKFEMRADGDPSQMESAPTRQVGDCDRNNLKKYYEWFPGRLNEVAIWLI
jgi:hypothetical protein